MKLKRFLGAALAVAMTAAYAVVPASAAGDTMEQTEIYNLKTAFAEEANGLNSAVKNSDYRVNDLITLHIGDGSNNHEAFSSTDGFIVLKGYNYIVFTPDKDGTVMLNLKLGSYNSLYVSENKANAETTNATTAKNGATIIKDYATKNSGDGNHSYTEGYSVTAGRTYYFLNADSSANGAKIASMKYTYNTDVFSGVKGVSKTSEKTYKWSFGTTDKSTEIGTEYTDYNNGVIDLTVSLGEGDMIGENGITFTASSVLEPETNLGGTKRYIAVTPKYDGNLTLGIQFTDVNNTKNNRVFYADKFDKNNLSNYKKDESLSSAVNTVPDNNGGKIQLLVTGLAGDQTTTTLKGMKAGETYVFYTYQKSSVISELSYAYTTKIDIDETKGEFTGMINDALYYLVDNDTYTILTEKTIPQDCFNKSVKIAEVLGVNYTETILAIPDYFTKAGNVTQAGKGVFTNPNNSNDNAVAYKALFDGLESEKTYKSPKISWTIVPGEAYEETGKITKIYDNYEDITGKTSIEYGLVIDGVPGNYTDNTDATVMAALQAQTTITVNSGE